MATRVTLKAINDELTKRGHNTRLEKASGYFYFMGGDQAPACEEAPVGHAGGGAGVWKCGSG